MTERLVDRYLAGATAENFDWKLYLAERVPYVELLEVAEFRRSVTEFDPLLFGLIYTPDLIRLQRTDDFSFAELHLELCRYAFTHWTKPAEAREDRDAFIAPRGCGKSTWLFLILPLWAMAHGHVHFIAAFSSAGPQATKHLAAFKNELDTNELLRADFPEFCNAMKRASGATVADTQRMYFSISQQTFFAGGLDEDVLGLTDPRKRRPGVIILDDIEPDESNYSELLVRKRLVTVRDTILPMNEEAHVVLVGTVTMLGSLMHQLVQTVVAKEAPADWIEEERFSVHYFEPIIDGVRSIWPAKWSLDYLLSIQHTRGYKKNFLNQPVPEDAAYWQQETFQYGTFHCTKVLIQIDPATTKKSTSDYYGVAVIGYAPAVRNEQGQVVTPARCLVKYARARRITPGELRRWIIDLITTYFEVGRVRIETNQGGDTWKVVLNDLPVRLIVHNESIKKELRAQDLVHYYERGQVLHERRLPEAENQMMAFPNVVHDDLVDAIGAGVRFFLERPRVKAGVKTSSYL